MGNCNSIQINSDVISFSFRENNIVAFHEIYIEQLNIKEINNIKKNLKPLKKFNKNQIKNIIAILKYLNDDEDYSFKSKIDFYIFSDNYVPILKIINKNVIKKDNNYYYKMCLLDKM